MATVIDYKTELKVTRVFDAPRELVWKHWSEPERFKRWWGPKHFTSPVSRIDFRLGGKYINCMRSPEGRDFWSTGVYREIVPLERIVFSDSFADEKGNIVPASLYGLPGDWPIELLVTVMFEDEGTGRTKITLRHAGIPSGKMSDDTETGWNESLDKLAESLRNEKKSGARVMNGLSVVAEPGKQEIILTREFNASRQAVFAALIDPDLIPKWWGPRRYRTIVDAMEVRPGGIWRFVHRDDGGNEYGFHGVYHAIIAPERLVYTFEFEGTPGHVSLETVALEEQDGRTKAIDRVVFQSVEDRDAMLNAGMAEGAAETMARFADLVEKLEIGKKAA